MRELPQFTAVDSLGPAAYLDSRRESGSMDSHSTERQVVPQLVRVAGCVPGWLDGICQNLAIPLGVPCEGFWWNRNLATNCYRGLLTASAPFCASCAIWSY